MEKTWRLLDSGNCSAAYNMAIDEALALSVREGNASPTLRLYGWDRPSLTIGSFQKTSSVDIEYCRTIEIPIVRRPTGGRAILHGDELTYSFSARTDREPFDKGLLDSYRRISLAINLSFNKIGITVKQKKQKEKGRTLIRSPLCFQSSSYGEILIDNRKIAGAAQKRWKDGLLQQGSIPYSLEQEPLQRIFRINYKTNAANCMTAVKDVTDNFDESKFKSAFAEAFEETFGITLLPSDPSQEESDLALELQDKKYLQDSWNFHY